jgi:transposase
MGKSITDLSSVTTVGLDLAKHVFQVHAIGAFGRVIVAKALRRKTCWPSSRNCPSVLSVWKPAVRPIIRRAS